MLATIARFCAARRRWVLAAWVLLFAAGITVGSMVFSQLKDSNGGAGTESVQGYNLLHEASSTGPSAVVLVKGPPVAAASTRTSVQALTARLGRLPEVTGAVSAYTSSNPMLRAPGGHASTRSITAHSRSRPSSCAAACSSPGLAEGARAVRDRRTVRHHRSFHRAARQACPVSTQHGRALAGPAVLAGGQTATSW